MRAFKVTSYGVEARNALMRGVKKLAGAVRVTMGPGGRNVILEREFGGQYITKDGVTVAKEFFLQDPVENMGCQVIKESAMKTNDEVGDGTTTSIVLTESILEKGMEYLGSNINPVRLKGELKSISQWALKEIERSMLKRIDPGDLNTVRAIATVSANGDTETGGLITDAIARVTSKGVITVGESAGFDSRIDVLEGLTLDKGFDSSFYITNPEDGTCELSEPYILLIDSTSISLKELVPVLDYCRQSNRPLLIVSDGVDSVILQTLVANKIQGILKVCSVKAPGIGDKGERLLDIAAMTRASVVSNVSGVRLSVEALGTCSQAIVKRTETSIIGGAGAKDEVANRVNILRAELETATGETNRRSLQERIGLLTNGAAVIRLGSSSSIEMKELRDRVDDSISATKSALEGGYVPGGGLALFHAAQWIRQEADTAKSRSVESTAAADILTFAFNNVLRTLCENAGDDYAEVRTKILAAQPEPGGNVCYGYDVRSKTFGDLLQLGVIDPYLVLRAAVMNSVSVASTLLTTECVVCNDDDDDGKKA